MHLAQSHVVGKDTLQKSLGSKAWNELIKCCSNNEEHVKHLVKILKLMKLEEPSKFTQPLLDHICKLPIGFDINYHDYKVEMTCPCNPGSHSILPVDFLLLELVEGCFSTSLQSIQSAKVAFLEEPLLSVIQSRMSDPVIRISGVTITIDSRNSAQAFSQLVRAQSVKGLKKRGQSEGMGGRCRVRH